LGGGDRDRGGGSHRQISGVELGAKGRERKWILGDAGEKSLFVDQEVESLGADGPQAAVQSAAEEWGGERD